MYERESQGAKPPEAASIAGMALENKNTRRKRKGLKQDLLGGRGAEPEVAWPHVGLSPCQTVQVVV
jgi:hypothetical protein